MFEWFYCKGKGGSKESHRTNSLVCVNNCMYNCRDKCVVFRGLSEKEREAAKDYIYHRGKSDLMKMREAANERFKEFRISQAELRKKVMSFGQENAEKAEE